MMLFQKFKVTLIFSWKKLFSNFFIARYSLHKTNENSSCNFFFELLEISRVVSLNILYRYYLIYYYQLLNMYIEVQILWFRIEYIFSLVTLSTSKGDILFLCSESLLTLTNVGLSSTTGEFSQAWQEIFLSDYQFLLLYQGNDLLLYTWDTPRYKNR